MINIFHWHYKANSTKQTRDAQYRATSKQIIDYHNDYERDSVLPLMNNENHRLRLGRVHNMPSIDSVSLSMYDAR